MTKTKIYCNYVSVILSITAMILALYIQNGRWSLMKTQLNIMFVCNFIQIIAFVFSDKNNRIVYLINGIAILVCVYFFVLEFIIPDVFSSYPS